MVLLGAIYVFILIALQCVDGLNNGAGLVPPLGWSSWCSDGPCGKDFCTEAEVKEAAAAMLSNGLYGLGYRWIIIDDCWASGTRTSNGSIAWSVERFPSGIPALTAWLHAKGLLFGIYTSAGNETCDSGGRPYPIPGSEGHYQQDMNSFAAWNVDYVKVDWCGDVKHMPLDGILVGRADYVALSHAITNTTPPRTMFFEGVAAMPFLLWDVEHYVNSWRANSDHHDSWENTMEVLTTVQLIHFPSKPGAWSYMDILATGGQGCHNPKDNSTWLPHCPKMTDEEYITEFSVWNVMQSPLIVATDIRNMTAIMKKILLNKRFYEIHQDTRSPAGAYLGGDDSCSYGILGAIVCQLWTRNLADGSVMVVMLNAATDATDPATSITLDFTRWSSNLPGGNWSSNTAVIVEDLWDTDRSGAVAVGKYVSRPLAPHSVNAVVLHPTS